MGGFRVVCESALSTTTPLPSIRRTLGIARQSLPLIHTRRRRTHHHFSKAEGNRPNAHGKRRRGAFSRARKASARPNDGHLVLLLLKNGSYRSLFFRQKWVFLRERDYHVLGFLVGCVFLDRRYKCGKWTPERRAYYREWWAWEGSEEGVVSVLGFRLSFFAFGFAFLAPPATCSLLSFQKKKLWAI